MNQEQDKVVSSSDNPVLWGTTGGVYSAEPALYAPVFRAEGKHICVQGTKGAGRMYDHTMETSVARCVKGLWGRGVVTYVAAGPTCMECSVLQRATPLARQ